jgi:transposase-like protein
MEKTRRQFTPQQKVAILREHLVEHVPVSDLCDKHKLHPTLFYQWQKAFFENGAPQQSGWAWKRTREAEVGIKAASIHYLVKPSYNL